MTREEVEAKCQAFANSHRVDFICETYYPIADDVDFDDREEFDEDGDYIPAPRSTEPDGYRLSLEMRHDDKCYEMSMHAPEALANELAAGQPSVVAAIDMWLSNASHSIKQIREQGGR